MNFCRQCGGALEAPAPPPAAAAAPVVARPMSPSPVTQATPAPDTTGSSSSQAVGPAHARLVTLLKDGSEGQTFDLSQDSVDIGSSQGDLLFADDGYLSPRHARLQRQAGTYTLFDLDSINGIYVRVRKPVPLSDGDMLLVGQQVLRFEQLVDGERGLGAARERGVLVFGTPEASRLARLVQYTTEGLGRDVYYLFRDETILGRENGDIVFTDDPFLSRKHAAVRVDTSRGGLVLHDLGSSNGTAVRVRGQCELRVGDEFRIGRHLFRFEILGASGP